MLLPKLSALLYCKWLSPLITQIVKIANAIKQMNDNVIVIYLALLFGMRKDKSGAPMNRIMSMRYSMSPNLCRNNMYRKSTIARIRKTIDSFFFTISPPFHYDQSLIYG
jgi:hypothetical protein